MKISKIKDCIDLTPTEHEKVNGGLTTAQHNQTELNRLETAVVFEHNVKRLVPQGPKP